MADGSGAIPAALPMGAPAGNPNGAQQFGAALSQAQANAAPPPPAPPPPAQGQPEIRGNFLPYVKNPQTGQVQWGVPQVVQGVVDAVTLPGDALAGKVDPNSPEGVARALNFALTVTGGSAAAPKPSGVLTMGIGNGVSVEIAEQVARSIDNLVGSSVPTRRTGSTSLFDRSGGFAAANADFDGLGLSNIRPINVSSGGSGRVGTLADGRNVIVRETSASDGHRPTLEIQGGPNGGANARTKFRYDP